MLLLSFSIYGFLSFVAPGIFVSLFSFTFGLFPFFLSSSAFSFRSAWRWGSSEGSWAAISCWLVLWGTIADGYRAIMAVYWGWLSSRCMGHVTSSLLLGHVGFILVDFGKVVYDRSLGDGGLWGWLSHNVLLETVKFKFHEFSIVNSSSVINRSRKKKKFCM